KFARRYWHTKGQPRAEFIALDESFHGRTFGSLSVTSDAHYRAPFDPLLPTVKFVRTNDAAALAAAMCAPTAEIIAETVLCDGGVLQNITRVGAVFERRLRAIAAARPDVKAVRGAGLMWGVELTRDAAPVVPAALVRGVVVNPTAETVVRLLPPLVISEAEAEDALGRLDAALGALGAGA